MIYYKVVKQKLYSEELGEYVSYGIKIHTGNSHIILYDVSTNKRKLRRLVLLCNKNCVDPQHLMDVIDDYMY